MRILHVIPELSERYGGPVQVLNELSSRLVKAGHETEIVTTNRGYPKDRRPIATSQTIDRNGVKIAYFEASISRLLISRRMAAHLARSVPTFDVVHIHGL